MLVASDLDKTLIYSSVSAQPPSAVGSTGPRLRCVEVYRGSPLSYVTERAARLLGELAREAELVPVTTRTLEQYERVRLPVPRPRYAVTTNGGRLIVDGEPDAGWEARVRRDAAACAPVGEVEAHLDAQRGYPWLLRRRTAEELFCYLVVERGRVPAGWLDAVRAWAGERRWTVSMQGRKIYFVPEPVTKQAAVEEVRQRTGAAVVVAAGDSLLDAGMLEAADVGFRPGHGELAESGWTAPGVLPVEETGLIGGEELARRMLAAARVERAAAEAGGGEAETRPLRMTELRNRLAAGSEGPAGAAGAAGPAGAAGSVGA
ncbi:hypothetical protein BIV57_05305 [Mangrovactinospora gilvigrisea]|uniref:HAD family hydrolase n=1 Tax=Mangrovactinospora gilvigrisea TaxID=1428644 RepID=A0A1J7BIU0_9ACTN|nr:hypothetical protein BIV57_05305 [Mangrovactinospora gilvigrisea]